MRLLLLESSRSLLGTAECVLVSILGHAGVVWLALAANQDAPRIPTDEREARVFFLLPPDRVVVRIHQTEAFQWGRLGGDLEDGTHLTRPSEGWRDREQGNGARAGQRNAARGLVPFGPVARLVPDTVFSVLEVDDMVMRYEGSAAPAYPSDLIALGVEGVVQTMFVVDTAGLVDTATVKVGYSDHPRFTDSVRKALAQMRFRPARRGGKKVRQQVEQQFRFRIDNSLGGLERLRPDAT